ncbi:MBOAT family O-acyltransferase [Butyrivibrio sp. VCB2006]|uniref:MBOAT family O-acyltransferase n=1 Tax=Butyrivibrio sp. VCB2006 TaxID=1280679 RepID=UPI000421CF47|nr:MBOAT family O-acyltransferase [Butyrivibrio sp. VCB2006]
MVFNSYEFVLIFLPIFLLAYNVLRSIGRKKGNARVLVDLCIILGSLCFYALFGMRNLAIIFISICINVCTAIPMSFMRERGIGISLFGREILIHKLWLSIGVILNVVLLLFFKLWGVFLPIAISFYTFNQISYIVDLERGDIEKFDIMNYLAYILFFPKLLQGPLMGYGDFDKEVKAACEKSFDYEIFLRAMYLFSIGVFKKVIMADTIGRAVDANFQWLVGMGSIEAVLTAVFYSFQLYFDFSGYCDMAAAVSMMLGIELPINFDSPYKAVNIVDFWKRWHITLTRFFTKYVYIPLGGNRKGEVRTYINFMIIFLISGFWHGTGWTFIIWGAMHGVLYVITRWYGKHRENAKINDVSVGGAIVKGIKILLTFIYVTAAWVFFRAETIEDALILFGQIFKGGVRSFSNGFSAAFQIDELWYILKVTPLMKLSNAWELCAWIFFACSAVMIFFFPNAVRRCKEVKLGIGTTLLTVLLLVWSIVSFGGVSTFLYMNF